MTAILRALGRARSRLFDWVYAALAQQHIRSQIGFCSLVIAGTSLGSTIILASKVRDDPLWAGLRHHSAYATQMHYGGVRALVLVMVLCILAFAAFVVMAVCDFKRLEKGFHVVFERHAVCGPYEHARAAMCRLRDDWERFLDTLGLDTHGSSAWDEDLYIATFRVVVVPDANQPTDETRKRVRKWLNAHGCNVQKIGQLKMLERLERDGDSDDTRRRRANLVYR